ENDTPFTPAHTLLRAMKVSIDRLKVEGIEEVWARHRKMANAARAGVEALGLKLFAAVPSESLTTAVVPAGVDGEKLLKTMEKQHGLKLAGGQDQLKGKIIRLSHMGYIDFFDVLGALSGLELALRDQGWRFELGTSLAAAQRAYAGAR